MSEENFLTTSREPEAVPERREIVERLSDLIPDTYEYDAESNGYYDTPLTFAVRDAITALRQESPRTEVAGWACDEDMAFPDGNNAFLISRQRSSRYSVPVHVTIARPLHRPTPVAWLADEDVGGGITKSLDEANRWNDRFPGKVTPLVPTPGWASEERTRPTVEVGKAGRTGRFFVQAWDCDGSPIGKCIGDSHEPEACCVFCGAPEERK